MSQPPPYFRSFGFTDFSASYPTAQQPGYALDGQLDNISISFSGVLANLAKLQRDDGALKNQIVTLDSLSPAVMLALGAGVIWLPRGAWVTARSYAISDVISQGTATYVCAVAHTAGTFATDLAAGKWTKLYDDAGSTPADGSVTAAKLAAGSVTTPAIGFTGLDLAGSIRAATGLQAGTAALGELLHAKAATGDALAKVERTTEAQGAVGYQIIGVSVTWQFSQGISSAALDVVRNGATVATFTDASGLDVNGTLRAAPGAHPATGQGCGMALVSGTGYVTSYNYGTNAWLPLKLRGLTAVLTASGVDVLTATSTGIDVTGTASRGGTELGWLDTPQNVQSAAYTLVIADRGKHIYSSNVAGQTVNIPTNASVAFPLGTTIAIVNDGTNPVTISTTGITLKQAGTTNTGNRTVAVNGVATLLKVGTDRWFITGAGVA